MKRDTLYITIITSLLCTAGIVLHRHKDKHIIEERVVYVEVQVPSNPIFVVTATVYQAEEEQCDSTPLVTASGAKLSSATTAYDHRYIAVSRDLLDEFPYGTKVQVSGCGYLDGEYTVQDTMNKRFTGTIDILINPDMRIGKWEGVRIKRV